MKYYKFNPEDFGYEHVSNFPELKAFFGNTTYVKVIADGSTFDRVVYWYSYCYKIGMSGDDRWKIASSSFDISSPNEFNSNTTYCGLISTDMFARKLLKNIFGTTQNGSVSTDGKERVEQNINKKRLIVE